MTCNNATDPTDKARKKHAKEIAAWKEEELCWIERLAAAEAECARLRAENEKLEYGAHDPPPLFLSDKASSALKTRAEKAEARVAELEQALSITDAVKPLEMRPLQIALTLATDRAEKAEAALERAHRAHAFDLILWQKTNEADGLGYIDVTHGSPPPVAALVRRHAKDPIGVCSRQDCGQRAPLKPACPIVPGGIREQQVCAWDGGCASR